MYKLTLPILGMIVFVIGCGSPQSPVSKEPVAYVKTQRVSMVSGRLEKRWAGKIESPNIIDLGFTIPGRIEHINVSEGESIKKGQILASIENTSLQNARRIAAIEVAKAQDILTRAEKLRSTGSIAEKEYQERVFQYEQAFTKARIAASEEKQSTLLAPFDGIIVQQHLNRGSIVSPGARVFTFIKTDGLQAVIEVHADDLPTIKKGMKTTILLPDNKPLVGIVTFINPLADNNSKTTTVKISFDQQRTNLYPGMYITATIQSPLLQHLLIEREALQIDSNSNNFVYVVKDSIAEKRKISLMNYENIDGRLIVTSGLAENEEVIIAGAEHFTDRQKVKILN